MHTFPCQSLLYQVATSYSVLDDKCHIASLYATRFGARHSHQPAATIKPLLLRSAPINPNSVDL